MWHKSLYHSPLCYSNSLAMNPRMQGREYEMSRLNAAGRRVAVLSPVTLCHPTNYYA